MAVLEVSNLVKHFGGIKAVDNVTFDVRKGEILGLIGPNGSGKSTTMNLIVGVYKPTSGIIRFNGKEIQHWPLHKRVKNGISIVFQHSRPLNRQTVLENIKLSILPDRISLFYPKYVEEKALEVAKLVGLEDVLNRYPPSLPFGYVRRMELAKALALKPHLLLLDEPFAGLTPSEVGEFSDLILSVKDKEHTIVLVDHNVKAIYNLVDRMVALHLGKKIAEGKPEDVVNDEEVLRVFIGRGMEDLRKSAREQKISREKKGRTVLHVNIKSLKYGKAEALRNVDIEVKEGEFVSVVGLNGAGKSSLLKAIVGLVSYNGDIKWKGQSIKGMSTAKIIKSGISFTPETRELFGYMTVEDNLRIAVEGLSKGEVEERMEEVFELFPVLKERRKQLAYTFSGGQQQMLTIARAMMQRPFLLMLDEPTLGLAPAILDIVSDALTTLREKKHLTILLAEQNLHFAIKHSERLYLLEHGSITWEGDPATFMDEVGKKYLA